MAGFVTANRWATGVETHKTSEGRILCTGVGCVGCFPEVFSSEASELGVCDVDLTSGILGLRPFLDEENSRESLYLNSKNFSRRQKKLRTRRKRQKRKIDVKYGLSDKGQDSQAGKQEFSLDKPQNSSSVATQTELSDMGIDAETLTLGSLSKSLRRPLLRRSWMRCPGESTSRSSPNSKLGSCSLAFAMIYQQQNSMVLK